VPEAIQLLALTCHLPTGVKGRIEQLVEMNLQFSNIDRALAAILSTALAEQHPDTGIKVLSPIQQYILTHFKLAEHYLTALYQYYVQIVHKYAEKQIGNDGFHCAMQFLLPEMRNITYLFIEDLNLKEKSRPGLALAAFKVSEFQNRTVPSGEILDVLLCHWPKYCLSIPYANGLLLQSKVYRRCNQYKQTQQNLKQAQTAFIEIGDQLGVAQCTQDLGDIHYMYDEHDQAIERLKQAQITLVKIGYNPGIAQCIQSLGNIHQMRNEHDQARKKLEQAYILFVEIGDKLRVAQCVQSLGNIHCICNEHDHAQKKLEQAQTIFVEIGDPFGAAQCMWSLGNIHYICNEYD
jgi:tetratricopeptide (TPR) repeat protein